MIDFVLPRRAVPMQLVAGEGHYDLVVGSVLAAQCSVWIATANLKDLMTRREGIELGKGRRARYRSVIEVFDQLAERQVELRILHATTPSRSFRERFDRHPRLVSGGLELRLCPRVHLKAVIVDGARLYLGSANWTGAGLGAKTGGRRNFELGLVTDDPLYLDQVQGLYDRIWRGLECHGCRRREICEAPLDTDLR
jgi:phosphatidylserine/phosphatidylglycerophosphate/cardiolipin synthase-like enzyme